jgi:uncharacterized protein (DUF2252 family)
MHMSARATNADEPKILTPALRRRPPAVIAHPTPAESAARGRELRKRTPRSSLAAWSAPEGRPDPVAILEEQAAARVPQLVPIRHERMLVSAFAYLRGCAAMMASDLAGTPVTGLRVQLCGDAHLANFGGFASPERSLVFDINDFDETLSGPWEWDVKRLATSFEILGRDRDFGEAQRRALVLRVAGSYRAAMRSFAGMRDLDVWYSHLDVESLLPRVQKELGARQAGTLERDLSRAYGETSMEVLSRLTRSVDGSPRIMSDPPLLVPIAELMPHEAAGTLEAFARRMIRVYRASLQEDRRVLLEHFQYADMARKVAGVGSVGTRSWVVLMLGRDEKDPLFLQVKEASASVLEPYVGVRGPADHGQRVVEGQRLMQASSDIFLGWLRTDGFDRAPRDYYVRQLKDWKTSVDVGKATRKALMIYASMCGWTLARAHARSGDRIALAAYLGSGTVFDEAIADFAAAYADQNECDREAFQAAVRSGRLQAASAG